MSFRQPYSWKSIEIDQFHIRLKILVEKIPKQIAHKMSKVFKKFTKNHFFSRKFTTSTTYRKKKITFRTFWCVPEADPYVYKCIAWKSANFVQHTVDRSNKQQKQQIFSSNKRQRPHTEKKTTKPPLSSNNKRPTRIHTAHFMKKRANTTSIPKI